MNTRIPQATLALFSIVAGGGALGQVAISPRKANRLPDLKLRIDKNLVLIGARVTDRNGHFVNGLDAQKFRVLDDKEPVAIREFSMEDGPVSTAILLDLSGSMKKTITYVRSGLKRYLAASLPGDDYCLITFADSVEGQCKFTTDPSLILAQASIGVPHGGTAMWDAIVMGLSQVGKGANPRKVLLILSDGDDTASRYSWREVKERARETLACLYAVVPEVWPEDRYAVDLLEQIIGYTGGRLFELKHARQYADFFDGLDIRRQYVIGFDSTAARRDGKYRRVTLRLDGRQTKGLKVYWKRGYYAPDSDGSVQLPAP